MQTDLAKALDEIGRLDALRSDNRGVPWEGVHMGERLDTGTRAYAIAVLNAAPALVEAARRWCEWDEACHAGKARHELTPLAAAPAASLRDGQGWWLCMRLSNKQRCALPMARECIEERGTDEEIHGVAYTTAAVLAWVRDGKLD